ncbi:MAG: DsbA family protein [Patescibacteria group bacterium]|nr:DsbA family protein [Patescibacteria group bacterium]
MPNNKELPKISIDLNKLKNIKNNQVLITLLVIVAFLLGVLYTKVQYLEKNQTGGNLAAPTAQQGTAGNQPAAPAPGQKQNVNVGHLPPLGSKDAKVKIVEFGDFRCPFCDRFFKDTEPQIKKDYIDTGKAVFYFRHYQFLGDASVVAGNASECANEQGKFWDFHNYFYDNQPSESDTSMYTTDKLTQIAGTLGMNTNQFSSCLSSKKYDKNVQDDLAAGQKAGVTGTPTVFINGLPIVGAQPYTAFQTVIDQELKK